MNNPIVAFDPWGIEVSHLILVGALRWQGPHEPRREFPNTAEGQQAVRRFLARSGRRGQVALESTGLYGHKVYALTSPALAPALSNSEVACSQT